MAASTEPDRCGAHSQVKAGLQAQHIAVIINLQPRKAATTP